MTRALAALLAVVLAAGCHHYPARVRFTAEATDRRLSRGESDSLEGTVERSDAANVYFRVGGAEQAVPRSDIAAIDPRGARSAVRFGAFFAIGGVVLFAVSAFYVQCPDASSPITCPFASKRTFGASLGVVAGASLTIAALRTMFSGMIDRSRTRSISVAPAPMATSAGGVAPGLVLSGDF